MMHWNGKSGVWLHPPDAAGFVLFWAAIIFARSMGAGNRRYEGGGPGAVVAENLLTERVAPAKSTRANTLPGSVCSAAGRGG